MAADRTLYNRGVMQDQLPTDEDPFENMFLSDRMKLLNRKRASRVCGSSSRQTPAICSLYLNQVVDVQRAPTADEKKIWEYVFGAGQNAHDPLDVLYEDTSGIRATRIHFTTLEPEATVHHILIDCWASVLNFEELSKTIQAPNRLFLPLSLVEDVMFDQRNITVDQKAQALRRKLVPILGSDPNKLNLNYFDMLFVPVSEGRHLYLQCFDMKTPRMWFIDNLLPDCDLTQYKIPLDFMSVLATYLENCGLERSNTFRELAPEFVFFDGQSRLKWIDSGIFLMRFMEAFQGIESVYWDTGLGSDVKRQSMYLRNLRTKYLAKMLLTDANNKRNLVSAAAMEYARNITMTNRARSRGQQPSTRLAC